MTEEKTRERLKADLAKAEEQLESKTVEGISDALSTLIGLARWIVEEAESDD